MKLFFVRWLVALLVLPGLAFGQAALSPMQNAVQKLVAQKAGQRGFAANDPRYGATFGSVGTTVAGAAAAAAVVTAAGVTAPAWVTAAALMGLSALFSAGIGLAIDGISNWIFKEDGSISVQTASGTSTVDYTVPVKPLDSTAQQQCQMTHNIYNHCSPNSGNFSACLPPGGANPTNSCSYPVTSTTFEQAVTKAGYSYGTTTTPGTFQNKSPTQAVADLNDEQKAKPLNPQLLATVADQAWKQASEQPGYAGLPYDSANPITAADAVALQSSSPASYPTVGDAVAPQPSGAASPWAIPAPAAQPAPGGDTGGTTPPPEQPADKPLIDWSMPGSSETLPSVGVPVSYTPTLFAAPTGCPAPVSFSMMGKPYTIGYGPFCDLMATLAPIFLALGAAAAALIFAQGLKS